MWIAVDHGVVTMLGKGRLTAGTDSKVVQPCMQSQLGLSNYKSIDGCKETMNMSACLD